MLPFLKSKKEASASVKPETITRPHDESSEVEFDSMEAVAEDILNALKHSDKKLLAEALRSAFELMDSEPHMEGPHTNE